MATVVFDLDGTISDPSAGICRGLNYSLERLHMEPLPHKELLRYIGPTLKSIFNELAPGSVEEGIVYFRDYYSRRGYMENVLYPHMFQTLDSLHSSGNRLCIATGKKTCTAKEVLKFFGISHFFTEVHGCGDGGTKTALLRIILSHCDGNAVMIGDRDTDFASAGEVAISSIGVKWGFAQQGELDLADAVANEPKELVALVSRLLEE